jgi:D-alanine-D-alanine ligase-like ATP-grasp enzyme
MLSRYRKRSSTPGPVRDVEIREAGEGAGFDLVLAGDTSLGDWYLQRAGDQLDRLRNNPTSFFTGVEPLISGRSLLVANLETVLSDSPSSPWEGVKNYLGWDSPERTTRLLSQIGVDTVSLANNHTMDFGWKPLDETTAHLRRAGIRYFGAGADLAAASAPSTWTLRPSVGEPRRLHIVGALKYSTVLRDFDFYAGEGQYGVSPLSAPAVIEQLRKLRASDPTSVIVLFPHWGQNYEWASDRMLRRARQFLRAGADVIIGHGAHMMQEITADEDGTTLFSIGNFVFNSRGRYDALKAPPYSCVARLVLTSSGATWSAALKLYPIVSDNVRTGYTPQPVTEEEAHELYSLLDSRSGQRGLGPFPEQFSLRRDDRGWHLVTLLSLSPRLGSVENSGVGVPLSQARPQSRSGHTEPRPVKNAATRQTATGRQPRRTDDPDRYGPGSTQACYMRALEAHGVPYEEGRVVIREVSRPAIQFTAGDRHYLITAARIYLGDGNWGVISRPDREAAALVRHKDLTNSVLRANGFAVPEGASFGRNQLRDVRLYFRALLDRFTEGFCIKPTNGGLGRHVYVGIKDEEDLARSFGAVTRDYDRVLVEETFLGDVHRFIWVGGRVSAIRMGRPMNVVGDGRSTIEELVRRKNEQRSSNPAVRHNPLTIGETERRFLASNHYGPELVPPEGRLVFLSDRSNRHAGADIIDTTDVLHVSYRQTVEAAVSALPDFLVCGVDVIVPDPESPASTSNHRIIELNSGPGIAGHHFPTEGTSRDVAGDTVDVLLNGGAWRTAPP